MRKLIALLFASSMVAAVPATVLGQATAPAVPGAPSVEAGVNAGAQFTWTDLLASVNAQAAGSAQTNWSSLIGGINAESNVQIIDVFSLEGSPAEAEGDSALQAALDSSGQSMTDLHSAIGGNQTLVDRLRAQGYAATDVVAINSGPDNSFLIYVKPAAGAGAAAPAP